MMKVSFSAPKLLAVFLVTVVSAWSEERTVTLPEYRTLLEHYYDRVKQLSVAPQSAGSLIQEIPEKLSVQTDRGTVVVQLKFLDDTLTHFMRVGPTSKPAIIEELTARLTAMRAEADRYEKAGGADGAMRARLDQILAAREFRRVRGPTEWELLKQRWDAWLSDKLRKLFPRVPDINNAGQVFVWVMIAVACSVFAVWLYRTSRERMERPREVLPFLPSARSWRAWLSEAREKAALGDLRDAIHLAFWAGVSRLESDGVWRPDKTRTPREYLNAIANEDPLRPTFSNLTRKFEATWYGGRAVSAQDFDQFVAELERLGCRG